MKNIVSLIDWQDQDCPVAFNGKVYDMHFVSDSGLVLKDEINGVYCFPSDGNIQEHINQVKHIAIDGHIQFGDSVWLQKILVATTLKTQP